MLSRNNKILVGCLALLLAMSVGYALFSDTITVNGTATAKGDFDMTATCQAGIVSKLGTAETLRLNPDGGYQNDVCSVVDDSVSLNTVFLYPGASRNFTVKFTNTGTIDAFFESGKVTSTDELCVADDLEGNNFTCGDEGRYYTTFKYYEAGMGIKVVAMEDPNGNLLSQSDLLEFYDPTTGNATLKPGYSAYTIASIRVDHAGQSDNTSGVMNVRYTNTFTFPFTQVTN